jgi:hypothetical protein
MYEVLLLLLPHKGKLYIYFVRRFNDVVILTYPRITSIEPTEMIWDFSGKKLESRFLADQDVCDLQATK